MSLDNCYFFWLIKVFVIKSNVSATEDQHFGYFTFQSLDSTDSRICPIECLEDMEIKTKQKTKFRMCT